MANQTEITMREYRLLWVLFLLSGMVFETYAQDIPGRVMDYFTGEGISGVSISSLDDGAFTRSDGEGYFVVTIPTLPHRIKLTHVAYRDTVVIVQSMSDSVLIKWGGYTVGIDVVEVNTGYQSIPQERSTGSFSYVDNNRLNEQVGADILSRLPAVSNGLIVDRSTTSTGRLMVRGLSTIRGPKEPLIILDNFPYDGDLNAINPNDVKDITILKDAAAASIWGVRAGNGVIVITTKKGESGSKIGVDISAHTRIGQRPDLFGLETLSSRDFIEVEELLFERGFYNSTINNRARPPLTPIVEMLVKKRDGEIGQEQYDRERERLETMDVRRDFLKHLYSNSIDQQYFLGLRNGGEFHDLLGSVGYDNRRSIAGNVQERLTLRFRNQWRLSSKLSLGSEIYYTDTKSTAGRPTYGNIGQDNKRLYPYARLADEDGVPLSITRRNSDFLHQVSQEGILMDWEYYPLLDYHNTTNAQTTKDILLNTDVAYELSKHLKIGLRYQSGSQYRRGDNLFQEDSYFARNLINSFSQINADGSSVLYIVPKGSILDYYNQNSRTHNARMQVDYKRSLGHHDIVFLAGTELRSQLSERKADRIYGLNEHNLSVANVDYSRPYPDVVTGNLSHIPNQLALQSTAARFLSVFANLAYTYGRRLTLSGSLRRDATNLFGLRTRDKWNVLWSLGGSWTVSNEDSWNVDNISLLKLRATYGFSGNIDPSMSAVSTIYYHGTNNYNNMPYARFQTYSNPDLKWESVATTNVGLDMDLFDSRLSINVDFFNKRADDLFGLEIMDPTAGVGPSVLKNVASINTRGADVAVRSKQIRGREFGWETEWYVSYSRDKVRRYYLDQNLGRYFLNERVISGIEGRPVYSFHSFRWAGLDHENGNPIGFYRGEESTNYADIYNRTVLEDLEYHGAVLPVWSGSMGNMFDYKGLRLSFRLTYKMGHFFRRNSIRYGDLYRLGIGHPDFGQRWQQPGDENVTDIPSMNYPAVTTRDNFYTYASVLTEKADHIRLQYININYLLKNRNKPVNAHIRTNLFLNIDNVGIVWRANKRGIDPDFYSDMVPPPSAVFSFGVKINM